MLFGTRSSRTQGTEHPLFYDIIKLVEQRDVK